MLFDLLFSNPFVEAIFRIVFSVVKYFIAAGIGYTIFYVWKRRAWWRVKIQQKLPSRKHINHEIFWSTVSRIIFGVVIVGIVSTFEHTMLYTQVADYGTFYLIFSMVALLFIHDTYFYWAHRLMHHPKLYRQTHKIHHNSTNPTPWAAFSFHPSEALIEVAILPALLFIMPLHPIAIIFLVLYQITVNIYGHSGYELFPRWWVKNPITKYINTSVHHNLHHKEFHYNFGLYFNHWDRWMGTLDPDYDKKFYAVKDRPKEVKHEKNTNPLPSV